VHTWYVAGANIIAPLNTYYEDVKTFLIRRVQTLGHASVAFTLTIYAHVLPSLQREAMGRLAVLVDRRLAALVEHLWNISPLMEGQEKEKALHLQGF
jgi:hypothetical protein